MFEKRIVGEYFSWKSCLEWSEMDPLTSSPPRSAVQSLILLHCTVQLLLLTCNPRYTFFALCIYT